MKELFKKQHLMWFIMAFLVTAVSAQDPYYYHTISSHGLSIKGGRTGKVNYMYQMSHKRQLKLSANYVSDSYDQDLNKIDADIYSGDIQFQQNVMNINRFFLHFTFGAGGYYVSAQDLLGIEYTERHFNFIGGLQAEVFLLKNSIALSVDYDMFYMPWSNIYEFLHIPTAGLTFYLH